MRELTAVIRNQIPAGRKSILDAYGEVLFQAWRHTNGGCRYEVENTLVQVRHSAAPMARAARLQLLARQRFRQIPVQVSSTQRPRDHMYAVSEVCKVRSVVQPLLPPAQGLIQAATLASTPIMGAAIRRVLGSLHGQKQASGVDAMLLRLYEPIIFRCAPGQYR